MVELKFAIIGFGGLGKLHFRNLEEIKRKAPNIQLVAICDVDESTFYTQRGMNLDKNSTCLDLTGYHLYTDVKELLDNEQLDFVITALPTYLHEEIAVMTMEKGIHVFSEKPMALSLEQAQRMLDAADKNNVLLMIGQCVRYFSKYEKLREIICDNRYGKVIKADFHRICDTPPWSWNNWMLDETKSGGAALDLHVHDVDYINWVFGVPKAVTSFATNYKMKHEAITTIYDYEDMIVTSVGEWGMPLGFPFMAGFTVRFEKAVVVSVPEGLKVYQEEKETLLKVESKNGHAEELVDFITCIREKRKSKINPPEDTLWSLKIALTEKKSAESGIKQKM